MTSDVTSGFNGAIHSALQLLYDHSSTYNVSIELVQKLAQQLGLDTFIDKDAYTHAGTNGEHQFKRLSIAGSLVLIDIDFLDDHTILKVSLSLANHTGEINSGSPSDAQLQEPIIESRSTNSEGLETILLGDNISQRSFLNTSAEGILLQNLTSSTKLNTFPSNLKYLASLDSLSLPNFDFFLYLDRIALILSAVSQLKKNGDDDDELAFTKDIIGEIIANNKPRLELGIFLKYWQDYRYINQELKGRDVPLIGDAHTFRFVIQQGENKTVPNYTLSNQWKIDDKTYEIKFKEVDTVESTNSTLKLSLSEAITIPKTVIEYLDLYEYETRETIDEVFQQLSGTQLVGYTLHGYEVKIGLEFPQEFINVTSLSIKMLNSISRIVPVFRNFHVFNKLIQSIDSKGEKLDSLELGKYNEVNRRALKESLRLPDGVSNEELMGLSLGGDNPALSSIKPINTAGADLDDFMKEDERNESEENKMEDESEENKEEQTQTKILMILLEVDYSSKNTDLIVALQGNVQLQSIDLKFKISNGQIQSLTEDVDMEGGDDKNEKLIKALKITEDVIKSIEKVYI